MEILSNPFNGTSKGHWRTRRYQQLDGPIIGRKNVKTIRIGGSRRRSWRIKLVPKLRIRMVILSPLKIWSKLKNAYVNMMVNLAGNVGHLNNGSAFAGKRIPRARQVKSTYSTIIEMQILSNPFNGSSKRYWRRRRYQRLHGAITNRKNLKTVRFRGGPQRSWRIKVVPKLRLRTAILSPLKIWNKLKNAYVNMMLNLAGNVGHLNNENVFGGKRIPKARQVSKGYSSNEFENRLVFEIYKALVASY